MSKLHPVPVFSDSLAVDSVAKALGDVSISVSEVALPRDRYKDKANQTPRLCHYFHCRKKFWPQHSSFLFCCPEHFGLQKERERFQEKKRRQQHTAAKVAFVDSIFTADTETIIQRKTSYKQAAEALSALGVYPLWS